MNVVECTELTKAYGKKRAVNSLSFTLEENKITGLIGRNGAGKTTLLKLMAGFLRKTSGEITVFAENPFNSLKVSGNLVFIDDNLSMPSSFTLKEILETARSFYPNWDTTLATRLFSYFDFDPKQGYYSLSKGMCSTFNMILGISARAALTIFDEPTSGMDSAVRKDFYRVLLKDYLTYPRTIILSSHLLNEIEDILEDLLLIKDGQKCLHLPMEDVKTLAIGFRGKSELIDNLVQGKEIYHRESLGKGSVYVVVQNDFSESSIQKAQIAGVELMPVSTDDLCVYLTAPTKGGIDDVFERN